MRAKLTKFTTHTEIRFYTFGMFLYIYFGFLTFKMMKQTGFEDRMRDGFWYRVPVNTCAMHWDY